MSKKAHADAIPGLEILANDVRCTHAAAVARSTRIQLFYLQSRGLAGPQAKRLMIEVSSRPPCSARRSPFAGIVEEALDRRLVDVLA